MKIPDKTGDCFEANGKAFMKHICNGEFPKTKIKFQKVGKDVAPQLTKEGVTDIIKEGKDSWRLIHCQPLFTDDEPYAHCWIENEQIVLDFSSHLPSYEVMSNKIDYYFRLSIPPEDFKDEWKGKEEHYKWFSYTKEDILNILLKLKSKMHWGAWDFECVR